MKTSRIVMSFVMFVLSAQSNAATLFVTNPNDAGPGSFRSAIDAANATTELDEIVFSASFEIYLNTPLPQITTPVHIRGDAHLANPSGGPGITLHGNNIALEPPARVGSPIRGYRMIYPDQHGLHLRGGSRGSTVRGIRFLGWNQPSSSRSKYCIYATSADCSVLNCHFEYHPATGSTFVINNGSTNYGHFGLYSGGERFRLGGTATGEGNIFCASAIVSDGVVVNNRFGYGSNGNLITSRGSLTAKAPYSQLLVGGTEPNSRNYFASNFSLITEGNSRIEANWFRINPQGNPDPGAANNFSCIEITGPNNTLGGDSTQKGNLVMGNIYVQTKDVSDTAPSIIAYNRLGIADNNSPFGLSSGSIYFSDDGYAHCENNIIHGAVKPGIIVGAHASSYGFQHNTNALLRRNLVTTSSGNPPILLTLTPSNTANSANDPLDVDSGPNSLLNHPVLSGASRAPSGAVTISGALDSGPNQVYRIEFFTGAATFNGPTVFRGETTVVTNASGNAVFAHDIGIVPGNLNVCATATLLSAKVTSPISNTILLPHPGRFRWQAGGITNGTEGANLTATIQRINGSSGPASIRVVSASSADMTIAGVDGTGRVNFADGEISKTITIHLLTDGLDELDSEIVGLTLDEPSGGATHDGTPRLLAINDIDATPAVAINNTSITEGNAGLTTIAFTATLSGPSGRIAALLPDAPSGTSANPTDLSDFAGSPTVMQVNPTTFIISVSIRGDLAFEPNETFSQGAALRLFTNSLGATTDAIATPGIGTITNDDLPPAQSFSFTSAFEGPFENSGNHVATITRTSSSGAVSVEVEVENRVATRGVDFLANQVTTLHFPDGVTTQTLAIALVDDNILEDSSNFILTLKNPTSGVGLSHPASQEVIIKDDDDQPTLVLHDVVIVEGSDPSSPSVATCLVSLAGETELPVTLIYETVNGTANEEDYTYTGGSLTFASGQTQQTILVPIRADTDFEPDETCSLQFSLVAGADTPDLTLDITITNDDSSTPVLSFVDVPQSIVEDGGMVQLQIVRTGRIDLPCEFEIQKVAGTAKVDDDYLALPSRFQIPSGERELFVDFHSVNDNEVEEIKTLTLAIFPVDGHSDAPVVGAAKFNLISEDVSQIEEIVIYNEEDDKLASGSTATFGEVVAGDVETIPLTIRNIGNAGSLVSFALVGPDAPFFAIESPTPPSSLPAHSDRYPLVIRFTPTGNGEKSVTLHITSSYRPSIAISITATGVVLSDTIDDDGDGLSNLAEHRLQDLGFDRRVAQPDLVASLFSNSNAAGLYTQAQLQALSPSVPLICRDPLTQEFILELGINRSTNLLNFNPMPIVPAGLSVTPSGRIQYRFTDSSPAAFYRIDATGQ